MKRTWIALAVVLAIGVGWMTVALVHGGQGQDGPVPAKPVKPAKTTEPAPPSAPPVVPPPPLPDVAIPPIPEVDDDPFKPGLPPVRVNPPDILEEGKRLFSREGRLEMDQIGRAIFVFDSKDKPMQLLESSWREYIETRTDYGKKKARWRISGIVTVYGKRNYLLVTNCTQIMPEQENL